MLAKLLKYEIKATARTLIPLYVVLLFFSIINRIINPTKLLTSNPHAYQVIISILSMTLYIGLVVAVCIFTLIIMIQRFYKNLLGDEGYLMFTLPVESWKHILSKLIISIFWTLLSFVVTFISIIIIANIKDLGGILRSIIDTINTYLGYGGFFTLPIYALLALVSSIIMIYTAITLGQLFSKHRILASFGMYCVIYAIYQLIAFLYLLFIGNNVAPSFFTGVPVAGDINLFITAFILLDCVVLSANFIITNTILKKRLNLQ